METWGWVLKICKEHYAEWETGGGWSAEERSLLVRPSVQYTKKDPGQGKSASKKKTKKGQEEERRGGRGRRASTIHSKRNARSQDIRPALQGKNDKKLNKRVRGASTLTEV